MMGRGGTKNLFVPEFMKIPSTTWGLLVGGSLCGHVSHVILPLYCSCLILMLVCTGFNRHGISLEQQPDNLIDC